MAVPPVLKTAIDDALAAWVCNLSDAAQLLDRLGHTEMIRNRATPGASLATQLATVAEVDEEYSEMIAYVRMMNKICSTAGPALVKHADMHRFISQYTVRTPHSIFMLFEFDVCSGVHFLEVASVPHVNVTCFSMHYMYAL